MPPAVATLYALDRCGGIPPAPLSDNRTPSGFAQAGLEGSIGLRPPSLCSAWSQPAEEQREKESEREPPKANHIPDNSLKPMS